jgi:hypothetical protein
MYRSKYALCGKSKQFRQDAATKPCPSIAGLSLKTIRKDTQVSSLRVESWSSTSLGDQGSSLMQKNRYRKHTLHGCNQNSTSYCRQRLFDRPFVF